MPATASTATHLASPVRVRAPARLHLGFLDLNGQSGRKFGSIGLAIASHNTTLEAKLTGTSRHVIKASDAQIIKINALLSRFYLSLGAKVPTMHHGIELDIIESIPEHAGLGSGTQLALTVATALCRLHGINASTQQIAMALQRGQRSGIGIAAFDQGGFIIDGGVPMKAATPPMLVNYPFPKHWRIVLIMEHYRQGVHGTQETSAFKELPTFPLGQAQAICHLTLMKLMPALIETDIDAFCEAITEIQARIGDHFSPVQGGRYTSQDIAILLDYAKSLGHKGIAQSSWGPTGCVFVADQQVAEQLQTQLTQVIAEKFEQPENFSVIVTQAQASGADIELLPHN